MPQPSLDPVFTPSRPNPIDVHPDLPSRVAVRTRDALDNVGVTPKRLATGLAAFSIGLGLLEIFASRRLARAIGLGNDPHHAKTLRAFGARELMSGVGLLSGRARPGWMWSRVAGDAMDLTFLGKTLATRNPSHNFTRLALATATVAAVATLDIINSLRLKTPKLPTEPARSRQDEAGAPRGVDFPHSTTE